MAMLCSNTTTSSTRGQAQYICSFENCKFVFKKKSRLINHFRIHTGERPFICKYDGCEKSYTRNAHLKRHEECSHNISTSLPQKKYQCPFEECNKEFLTLYSLKRHINVQHTLKNLLYKCDKDECSAKFHKKCLLSKHKAEAHNENQFICQVDLCKKKFSSKCSRDRHSKIHNGYSCTFIDCGLTFFKWSLLRKHYKLSHPKQFSCSECSKIFTKKSLYDRHTELHKRLISEDETCFSCTYKNCSKVYSSKTNLSHHVQVQHKGRRFQCTFPGCDKIFKHKNRRKSHFNTQHSSENSKKTKTTPKEMKSLSEIADSNFDESCVLTDEDELNSDHDEPVSNNLPLQVVRKGAKWVPFEELDSLPSDFFKTLKSKCSVSNNTEENPLDSQAQSQSISAIS